MDIAKRLLGMTGLRRSPPVCSYASVGGFGGRKPPDAAAKAGFAGRR